MARCRTTIQSWSTALKRCAPPPRARWPHPRPLADGLIARSPRSCVQLREKREELNKSIAADEEEKGARRRCPPATRSLAMCDALRHVRRPSALPIPHANDSARSRAQRRALVRSSQDSERPSDSDRAPGAHQRQPCAPTPCFLSQPQSYHTTRKSRIH